MSDRRNAVIDGTYSDFKIVKTRSVFQMVIEGPIERAAEAVAMFGVPQPGQEIHVAIARLEVPAPAVLPLGECTASIPVPKDAVPGRDAIKRERAKAQFAALPSMKKDVVRASMWTSDETFQGWMLGEYFALTRPEDRQRETDQWLKAQLMIGSKAEIGEDEEVNERWRTLEATFLRDTNQLAEVRG